MDKYNQHVKRKEYEQLFKPFTNEEQQKGADQWVKQNKENRRTGKEDFRHPEKPEKWGG